MRKIPIILLILFLSCNICSAKLESLGDMTKSTYDADRDKIVDDSEKLGTELPSFYAIKSEVVNATTTLQSNIDTEESARIAADNLIAIDTTTLEASKLSLSGGTMTGDINMDSNNLLDVSTGVFVLLKATGTDGLTLADKDGLAVIFIEDGGNVGIGSVNPGLKLDIVTGQVLKSGFHLGEDENSGGWFTSLSTMQMVISAGAEFTPFGWLTKCSSPSLINLNDGDITFFTDNGLTSGAGFTPSQRMIIDKTGNVEMFGDLAVSGDIAGDVLLSRIDDSTHKSVQHMQNIFHSAGWVFGGEMTENGSTVDISSGTGLVRTINNSTSTLSFFDFDGLFGYTPPSEDTVFVGVEHNNGSPRISTRTTDNFNNQTDFLIGIITEENSQIHTTSHKHKVGDHANLMIQRLHGVQHLARDNLDGGLILGVTGIRNVTMTAGKIWLGLEDFIQAAIDTSGADTFDRYFRDSPSGFIKISATTTFDNGFWDDGSGTLIALSNNRYTAQYFYMEVDGELVSLYGRAEYNTEAGANSDPVPSTVPERLDEHGLLIGRIIIQEGNDTPISVETIFTTTFEGAQVVSHTELTDIGTNTHAEIDAKLSSLAISTPTFQLELTTITWVAADSELLDGNDSLFFAVASEVGASTEANANNLTTHAADSLIHYATGTIAIPASQITDFDTEVSNNASVTANTAKSTSTITHADLLGLSADDHDGTYYTEAEVDNNIAVATSAIAGDNLGDHTATQDLTMVSNSITNISSVIFVTNGARIQGNTGDGFFMSMEDPIADIEMWFPKTVWIFANTTNEAGDGTFSPYAGFMSDGNIIFSTDLNGILELENIGTIRAPMNSICDFGEIGRRFKNGYFTYGVVAATGVFTTLFGDGSNLTGIVGDNLGNHIATEDINVNGNDLNNVSHITSTADAFYESASDTYLKAGSNLRLISDGDVFITATGEDITLAGDALVPNTDGLMSLGSGSTRYDNVFANDITASHGVTGSSAIFTNNVDAATFTGDGSALTGDNSTMLVSSFPKTGVIAGSFTNTDLTVDAFGNITAASNGAGGGSATQYVTLLHGAGASDIYSSSDTEKAYGTWFMPVGFVGTIDRFDIYFSSVTTDASSVLRIWKNGSSLDSFTIGASSHTFKDVNHSVVANDIIGIDFEGVDVIDPLGGATVMMEID